MRVAHDAYRTAAFLLLVLLGTVWAAAADEVVTIDAGQISGKRLGDGEQSVRVYQGIPFAAPPVGPLRWRPPAPVAHWQGVRHCDAFGPVCPQLPYPAGSIYAQPPQPQSEDCLYLNVWTPAKRSGAKLPVMVWIHGGALTRGAASLGVYDGQALARRGVVLVTINYRLGPFGYLAHPALSRESEHGSSGNYGVLDQIAALQWVQRNIGALGGDLGRVTIFGESAGSWSVCALVASPLAKGLFQRAIGQSGGCFGPMQFLKESRHGLPPAEQAGMGLAQLLGCGDQPDVLAAMRAKSAEELLTAAAKDPAQARTRANVDGWVFPDEIYEIYAQGKHNHVTAIVGSNADEGTSLAGAAAPRSVEALGTFVKAKYGPLAEQFAQVYPATSDSNARQAFLHSSRDEWFTWEMRTWARLLQKSGDTAYLYYFTRVPPRPDAAQYGAYHAAEIPYVFDNLGKLPWQSQDIDQQLASALAGAWTRFAATGNPNGGGMPEWPAYQPNSEAYFEFGDVLRGGQHLLAAECDFVEIFVNGKRAVP